MGCDLNGVLGKGWKGAGAVRLVWTMALGVALMLAAGGRAWAQKNPLHTATQQELDVVKVMLEQERAWNNGDIDAFLDEFKNSPDIVLIGHGITHGYAQVASDYKHDYLTKAAMGTLGYSEVEVVSLSDTVAVVMGKYHLDRSKKEGGPADGVFSAVLQKTDQGWKIVVDHTT